MSSANTLIVASDRRTLTVQIDGEEGSEIKETPEGWVSPAAGSPHATLEAALNAVIKHDLEAWGERDHNWALADDIAASQPRDLEF